MCGRSVRQGVFVDVAFVVRVQRNVKGSSDS